MTLTHVRLSQRLVVAPILISQCYNFYYKSCLTYSVVAPFLISQCYNPATTWPNAQNVVAPFLISQCYNTSTGNPYFIRVSRFICYEKMGLK